MSGGIWNLLSAVVRPDDRSAVVHAVIGRLTRLRTWVAAPGRREVALAVAVVLFVVSTVLAWRDLPEGREIDWSLVALAAALVPPGVVTNAEEFRVSARILEQTVTRRASLRVAVIASAFNILPVPGSVIVRTGALARGGATTRQAVGSTAAVGIAYVAVAVVLVGVVQVPYSASSATGLVVAGSAMFAAAGLVVHRLAPRESTVGLVRALLTVEAVSVTVKALRLLVTLRALGFDPTFAQAASISIASVAASAIGVFPGGLGIRELLAAAIAPTVDLPAAVGLAGTAVDRLVGVAVLSVLAVVVLTLVKEQRLVAPGGSTLDDAHQPEGTG